MNKIKRFIVTWCGGILGVLVIVSVVAQVFFTISKNSGRALGELRFAKDPALELLLPEEGVRANVMTAKSPTLTRRQIDTTFKVKKAGADTPTWLFATTPGLEAGLAIDLRDRSLLFGDGSALGEGRAFQVAGNVGYSWKSTVGREKGLEVRTVSLSGISKRNRCRLLVKIQKMSNGIVTRDETSDLEYQCGI